MRFRNILCFFLCICTVESFVTTSRRTAVRSEEDLLARLRDYSKDLDKVNNSNLHNATRAKILVKQVSDAWNRITKGFKKENVNKSETFEFHSWSQKVRDWTKTKRKQMVDRLYRSEGTKSNATSDEKAGAVAKNKESLFQRLKSGRTSSKEKEGVLIAGSLMDLMMILTTSIDPKSNWVPNVNIALWWIVGIVVQMVEGDLNFIDAAFMMMQIDTSIGFGSNCPTTNGHKLFTALHIFLGSMFVQGMMSGYLEALFDKFDEMMFPLGSETPAGTFFVDLMFGCLALTGTTTLHALVDGTGETSDWIDGLYMSVAAFQSTGYGDIAPDSPLTRALSVIWATIGARFWGSHVADKAQKYFDSEHKRRFGTIAPQWEELPAMTSRDRDISTEGINSGKQ